jgi:hypothetical protein
VFISFVALCVLVGLCLLFDTLLRGDLANPDRRTGRLVVSATLYLNVQFFRVNFFFAARSEFAHFFRLVAHSRRRALD